MGRIGGGRRRGGILGREFEQALLRKAIRSARSGFGSVLVVLGEAGVGKTTLLEDTAGQAKGFMVLRATGSESESELPYGALYGLVRPLLGRVDTLPEPQAAALNAALALGPPVGAEPFAVGAATLSLLSAAADEQPVLCLVDDAHWLDAVSARALLFAARRLGADAVTFVLSALADESGALDLSGLATIRLEGLDKRATGVLLQPEGDDGRLSADVLDSLIASTNGNPLALLEVVPRLTEAQRSGRAPLPDTLPIGPGTVRIFERRTAALSPAGRTALLIAALGPPAGRQTVDRALATLDIAPDAIEEVEGVGLVSLTSAEVAFHHPLVRAASVSAASAPELRAAHAALARAHPEGEETERAWHLARAATGHDELAASALERAAGSAAGRGDAFGAARALAEAAKLTPDRNARARRLLGAAGLSLSFGSPAAPLLAEALRCTTDPLLRLDVQILRLLEAITTGQRDLAKEIVDSEQAEAIALDAERAAQLIGVRLLEAWATFDITDIEEDLDLLRRLIGDEIREGPPTMLLSQVALACIEATFRGNTEPALRLVDVAINAPDVATPLAVSLQTTEQHDALERLLRGATREARRRGALAPLSWLLASAGYDRLRSGNVVDAYALATEGLELAERARNPFVEATTLALCAHIESVRGSAPQALSYAERAAALAEAIQTASTRTFAYAAQAVAVFNADLERAADHLYAALELARDWPSIAVSFHRVPSTLIECLVRLDRLAEAQSVLCYLEQVVPGLPGRWPQIALHCSRGLLASPDDLDGHFSEALDWCDGHPSVLDEAHTRLLYGERLRRAGRRIDARTQLTPALAVLERIGAVTLADRARNELRATGQRMLRTAPRGDGALTPQELQVALAVARGQTNRDVAAGLFLSPKTIEMHLSNVFRKLGINTRAALAKRVAEGGADALGNTRSDRSARAPKSAVEE